MTSDADDQLIVYIPFRSPVKLRTIKVEAPEGKPAPSNMKVFVNRPTIGFEEVEDEPATQSFELESENLTTGGKPVETHFTKFRQGLLFSYFCVPTRNIKALICYVFDVQSLPYICSFRIRRKKKSMLVVFNFSGRREKLSMFPNSRKAAEVK